VDFLSPFSLDYSHEAECGVVGNIPMDIALSNSFR